MPATHTLAGRAGDPRQEFAEFLQRQATQSGLKVRDIAELFELEARREEEAADGGSRSLPEHPIRKMAFSKSHLARLFRAQALPSPPWPFTLQFLRFTSRAAGLTKEEHQERCAEARDLLSAIASQPKTKAVSGPVVSSNVSAHSSHETVVALQHEVELERARHTETRLRYALRDSQFLATTLWRIISALRDIICDHDALVARAQHSRADPVALDRLRNETEQALTHKRTAQEEVDLATARIRVLEATWEQARAEVSRLLMHPDTAELIRPSSDSAPAQNLLPADLLAQPTLDDIAAALDRAQVLNTEEERAARDLQRSLTSASPLRPDDERAVLLAATKLTSNSPAQQAAAEGLAQGWSGDPQALDALIRLTHADAYVVRHTAAQGLAQGWSGDAQARDALIRLTHDQYQIVRGAAAVALGQGWLGDAKVRDALIPLTEDAVSEVRGVATLIVARGWPDARRPPEPTPQVTIEGAGEPNG
ncbi:HEAT repeat domain-containing protein [Streptomyces albidocamelliae]|uniref:HEAT repeat domain-containing protein n=1 Tax=Streptomyces albidocamelliae TaxID=2981135 RepID=A0ABY6EPD1_9ACTN|nr:HEAT repeat domain-containing protein [Streptomyces sp. HUAS 14-6]UXY36113.1 HEAT repeat domain-containing protein [Streptomyces sp. HUAS 14-6]